MLGYRGSAMIPDRLRPILDEIRPVAERFEQAGYRLYLVGGIVRDLLDGRSMAHPDIDLTTDALPSATKELVADLADAVWNQGEKFGTIAAKFGARTVEITTHRAEAYEAGSRKPTVEFSTAIESDLSRRDFTVNAMALALPEPELIDPFDGRSDLLVHRRLRTPLSPDLSFTDDPLRMMRAARFIPGYGLEPVPELVEAVIRHRERMEIVSAERIRVELDKLLVLEDPGPGLWFLHDTGLFDEFLPEIPGLRLEQDPIHHHKDVLSHTFAVVGNVAATRPDGTPNRITRLAALLHDVGKPKTRSIGIHGVSFHHHEVVGARMARERLQALRYSAADVEAITKLVYLHLRFHGYEEGEGGWTDAAVRRYVRDAGSLLYELNELTRADCTTRNERKARMLARRMDALEQRIERLLEEEELKSIRPDLDGREVMDLLGIGPGRAVGEALAHLLELRLDHGPMDRDKAEAQLRAWWADRAG
jgi:poly(A) polymerase